MDALALAAERERELVVARMAAPHGKAAQRVDKELHKARISLCGLLSSRPRIEPSLPAALAMATEAHEGQVDKSGQPYLGHPLRVAAMTSTPDEMAAAMLHDVLEDGPANGYPASMMAIAARIAPQVAVAVHLLTRVPHVQPEAYYAAIRRNPVALAVKLADIADNTDPDRTVLLDPEVRDRLAAKYERALVLLTE